MEDKSSSDSLLAPAAFPLRHCMQYPSAEQLNRRTRVTVTPRDRAQAHEKVKKVNLPEAALTWLFHQGQISFLCDAALSRGTDPPCLSWKLPQN